MKMYYALMLFSVALVSIADASVTITNNSLTTVVYNGLFNNDIYKSTGVIEKGDPLYGTHHLFSRNISNLSAELDINYSSTHGQTILNHVSRLNTNGIISSNAEICGAEVYGSTTDFTVDRNATYDISGLLEVKNKGSAGRVFTTVHLYDRTDNHFLFKYSQGSEETRNEEFELGEQEGYARNTSSGSPTGNLQPRHKYELYWSYGIQITPETNDDVSATGDLTLTIEESMVPYFDSSTIIIWSMIAAYGGVLYYRGGKRKQESQNVGNDAANNEPGKELNNKLTNRRIIGTPV